MRVGWILFGFLAAATGSLFGLAVAFDTFIGDIKVLEFLRFDSKSWREGFARFDVTQALSAVPALAMAVFFIALRKWWESITAFLLLPAQGIAILLPKALIDRPRPPGELEGEFASFPSGTAVTAILGLGLLIYFVGIYVASQRLRVLLQTLLGLTILLLGLFRLFAGEHWPSDVLGGFMAGGLFLILIIWVYRNLRPARF